MKTGRIFSVLTVAVLSCTVVQARDITGKELENALKKNPAILIEAIRANKQAVFDIIKQESIEDQARQQAQTQEAERRAFEESFKNPFKPAIDDKTRIRGALNAKYTLVEYADFQCPYCLNGYRNVEALRKQHGADIRFVFKHLPLPFHPLAMPSALWMEAIAMQSPDKAWQFHDMLFENQDKLGVEFFKQTAKELGLDVAQAEKDADSQVAKNRVAADMAEAGKFGFNGTPGFLLNGIPVKGAYPVEYFEDIIKKLD
jgi:protein-disulfide isomerase